MEDYLKYNKELWNKRTEVHVKSDFYDIEGFIAGKESLTEIELGALGDVKGKSVLHLQCHFGQDTLSFARKGAKATGVDLSDTAISEARKLNDEMGLDAKFVCCNVLDIDQHLDEQFDIVFSSYGTIGWLPEITKWGRLIYQFLKPGGEFHFAEFHPVIWMYDDNFNECKYSYFNKAPILEVEESTYADTSADINLKSYSWNHTIADVLTALLDAGLQLKSFNEYDYSPFDIFNGGVGSEGHYQIEKFKGILPLVYSLVATKTA